MNDMGATGWIVFGVTAAALLMLDLGVHRARDDESQRSAVIWTILWIAAGLGFCGFVWWSDGASTAQEYLAAYLIEKGLSLDNLFVFLVLFQSMKIPLKRQRTALFWGVFGAVVLRALFIFAGAAAIRRWEWVGYVFAAILVIAAWHAFRENPAETRKSRIVNWLSSHLPVTKDLNGRRFLVRRDGRWQATPLLVAVIGLELTDVMFAIDSVPAAFSVTRNEFVIYSSNIFALLGLRALYIALVQALARLEYLHYGLSAVLTFAAIKLALSPLGLEIPPLVSAGVIVACIGAAVAFSVRSEREAAVAGHS